MAAFVATGVAAVVTAAEFTLITDAGAAAVATAVTATIVSAVATAVPTM